MRANHRPDLPLPRAAARGLAIALAASSGLFGGTQVHADTEYALILKGGAGAKPHVEVLDEASFDVTDALTVEAWVKFDAVPADTFPPKWQAVVTKGDAWGLTRFLNTSRICFRTSNGEALHDLIVPADFEPDTWYHVAGVFDGGSHSKSLYVNGVLVNSASYAGPLATNDFRVLLGGNEEYGDRALAGVLDTVRVWSLARTQEQLRAAMRRHVLGTEAGLLGGWRFDEAPGTEDAEDVSANDRGGKLRSFDYLPEEREVGLTMGSPTGGTLAMSFNGVDQYVELSHETNFDLTTAMTVEAWVYVEALAGDAALVSKGDSAWQLGLDAAGKVVFSTSGVSSVELTSATQLELQTWTHVAAVWDGAAKFIYIDGELEASSMGLTGSIGQNDTDVRFGANPSPEGEYLNGMLDEVRLWSGARAGELIAQNRNRELTGHEPHLVGLWTFDTDNGDLVVDSKATVIEGQPVVIDFGALTHDDYHQTPHGSVYEEDGFVLTNLSTSSEFYSVGTQNHDYSGSTALYNNDPDGIARIQAKDGSLFRFMSITLSDFQNRPTGALIPFTITYENGETTKRTLAFAGGGEPRTCTFTDLHNVKSVEWKQVEGYYQFDDIVVQPGPFVGASIPSHGIAHNMTDSDRVAGMEPEEPVEPQYALQFDGAGTYIEVPHHEALNLGSFTVEAWVKPEPIGHKFRNILMKGDYGYGLALDHYGRLRYWTDGSSVNALACDALTTVTRNAESAGQDVVVEVEDAAGFAIDDRVSVVIDGGANDMTDLLVGAVDPVGGTITLDLAANVPAGAQVIKAPVVNGQWQHVAVSVDQSTNTTAFHVGGQPAGDHESRTVNNNDGPLIIGRQGANTAAGYYKGVLNELRIWEHVRSGSEIELLSSRQLVPGMLGLAGYWNFNDGVGTTVADGSGNGLDGVLRNAGWDWVYGPRPPHREGMYALAFDGYDDFVEVKHSATINLTTLTIEAWVYPQTPTSQDEFRTILYKGDCVPEEDPPILGGYNLAIDQDGFLRYWVDDQAANALASTRQVADGRWQHVAVVIDGASVTFYINGKPAGSAAAGPASTNEESLFIGRQGLDSIRAKNYYRGLIDELRIWDRARSEAQIQALAQRQLAGDLTGLAGYWSLNEGDGLIAPSRVNDFAGTLKNMSVSAWTQSLQRIDFDGPFWEADALGAGKNFSRVVGSTGLWVGRVVINAVTDVNKAQPDDVGEPEPTADTASFRILLHVDDEGKTRLLRKVTLMHKVAGQSDNTIDEEEVREDTPREIVLVTDDTKLPEFQGLLLRRGRYVGKRIGTIGYDFEGNELDMTGGVGAGMSLTGKVVLPRLHPTNPFRHRYHPGHRNINPDNEDYGFEIARTMTLSFAEPNGGEFESGGYGVDRLLGTYREVYEGLHKVPIIVSGLVTIDRLTTVGALNE